MEPFACIAELRGQLLESPVWDADRQVLFLCDIESRLIHEIGLTDGPRRQWEFGDRVPSLGLCDSGRLVVALSREVILFDPDTGQRETLWRAVDEPETSRLNDGKVGPDGAFWVGSMDMRANRQSIGNLYRVTSDGRAQVMASGFEVSNGLAWTGDGAVMFHSDSRGPWIDRYRFDAATGAMSDRQRIATLTEAEGRPDGGATDIEGCYWSAGVSAGVLNRFAQDGRLLGSLPVPAAAPTMPCFCGDGLGMIAVTSHRQGTNPSPQDGGVFLARSPVAGAPVSRMTGV